VIDNIDRIVKYNEYKEIQKYLEPISLVVVFLTSKKSHKNFPAEISSKMEIH